MKAIVQEGYGPAHAVLRLAEIAVPRPAPDEVLVCVHAAAVHADVWHVINGLPYVLRLMGSGLRRLQHPIPGLDMAGVVVEVGAAVSQFKPGDAVFGETHRGIQWRNGGAYAEYVAAPADVLARKPANVTFAQAAAVATSGMIALQNLHSAGPMAPGAQVLVNGAGGGVGTIAVQVAKAGGAVVTAVDRAAKFDLLRTLGADRLIDYTQEKVLDRAERYDLIFDVASNLRFADCRKALTPSGKYVVIGHDQYGTQGCRLFGSIPAMLLLMARTPFTRQLPAAAAATDKQALMAELAHCLAQGQITPVIERTFELGEAADAVDYLASGRAVGRIVVVVESNDAG